jgi:hypothetical protein
MEFSLSPEKRTCRAIDWSGAQGYQEEHLRHAGTENPGISFILESMNANALLPTDSIFDHASLAVQNQHLFDNIVGHTGESSFHSSVRDFDFDFSAMEKHGQNPFDEISFPILSGCLAMESLVEKPSEGDANEVCFGAVCTQTAAFIT